VDYVILALYFACVLGIGWRLRKKVHTSRDFLTSGRAVPVWITSLAFLAANLGAPRVLVSELASVLSAFGAATSEVRRERVRSLLCHLPMDPAELAATLNGLREEVLSDLLDVLSAAAYGVPERF
jgi:hypothetical protein